MKGRMPQESRPNRVIVLGAGAIGASVGALLYETGVSVVLVARGEHGRVMAQRGLDLRLPFESRLVDVPVVSSMEAAAPSAADLVLLSVMGHHTAEAVASLPLGVPIVSMQNGTAPLELLRHRGYPLIAGMVYVPAERRSPGVVALAGIPQPGAFLLGTWCADLAPPTGWIPWLVDRLRQAGFLAEHEPDIGPWVRAKLLGNLGGIIVALCDAPPPVVVEAAQAEARRIWRASGQGFRSPQELYERVGALRIAAVDGLLRRGGSTRHALGRGQRLETDCLHRPIVDLGASLGIPTPVNTALIALAEQAVAEGWEPGQLRAEALCSAAGLEYGGGDSVGP